MRFALRCVDDAASAARDAVVGIHGRVTSEPPTAAILTAKVEALENASEVGDDEGEVVPGGVDEFDVVLSAR